MDEQGFLAFRQGSGGVAVVPKGEIESLPPFFWSSLRMRSRCRRSVINIQTAPTDTLHLHEYRSLPCIG